MQFIFTHLHLPHEEDGLLYAHRYRLLIEPIRVAHSNTINSLTYEVPRQGLYKDTLKLLLSPGIYSVIYYKKRPAQKGCFEQTQKVKEEQWHISSTYRFTTLCLPILPGPYTPIPAYAQRIDRIEPDYPFTLHEEEFPLSPLREERQTRRPPSRKERPPTT